MVVRRQYAEKGIGIQKRPPPPPKININNLIVDDKVKLSEKQKSSKKKSGKKSKSSPQLLGVPRCEASREVLQSREPESSHRRSSRARSRSRSRGRSRSERRSPSPPRQRSLPQPPPPKEYAIAPSAMKRTKSLTKTAKPSTNSKAKLFGAKEAKKKAAAAATKANKAAKAQQQARSAPPKWNQVLYGPKSSCNKSLASTNTRQKKTVIGGQKITSTVPAQKPAQKKVVRINAPSGSVRTSNTRTIQKKPGLDDKIIMALDNCIGDFDLYDFLEDTGERVEGVQQYLKDGDESTMPGKAKLLYQKSTETYQESQKQIGERFERSMKAMVDADEGLRPEPESEPEPELEEEEEEISGEEGEEIVQKDRNMDFAVEVTTDDTVHANSNSLDALLKKSEPQEASATKDDNAAAHEEDDKESTQKKKVDLTPIKKQIKSEVKQAKKSASLRLGLYLQGLAKDLIGEEAADNLCCSALESTGLEEEALSKSTIEKELEERKKRADNGPSVAKEQQQQVQDAAPKRNIDENSENVADATDEITNKDVRADTPQEAGAADQNATLTTDADTGVSEEGKEENVDDGQYLYPPFQSTFPIDQKVPDLLESKEAAEEEGNEEVIETSTQRIEGKLRELVHLLDARNAKKVVDVAAVLDEPKDAKTEEMKEESNSIMEEKEGDREMDNVSLLSF